MHDCPDCGAACYCDLEDHGSDEAPDDCSHDCGPDCDEELQHDWPELDDVTLRESGYC